MTTSKISRSLLVATFVLVNIVAALSTASTVVANHENYGFWHHDGCYWGHFGEPGYGYWDVIECASSELGYVDTDDCYYHFDGSRDERQACWVYGQNGDSLMYVHYADGAFFSFLQMNGVKSQFHFHVDQDEVIWIEVVPALSSSGWMPYEDYIVLLQLQGMITELEGLQDQQNADATASANNTIMLSQQFYPLLSQAVSNVYGLDVVP